jgi:hypothetical protein
MKKNLGKFGEIQFESPDSMATCFEIVTLLSTNPDSATLSRLCSCAIGICSDKEAILPSYRPLKEKPLEYGYRILERLLERGCNANHIFDIGMSCIMMMSEKIPSEEGVKENINFSNSQESDTSTN